MLQTQENPPSQASLKTLETFKAAPFLSPAGPQSILTSKMLEQGMRIRDEQLHHIPIVPEACAVFVDLASTREWAVSAKPRVAARAVEWLNEARTQDVDTGYIHTGFEQYLRRRARDYICIGRTAFAFKPKDKEPHLEYIDPCLLRFRRKTPGAKRSDPVKPNEQVWSYDRNNRDFKSSEIFLDHPIPMGTNGFMAPIAYVLKSGILAWLLREHNSAALDGRRIRDILMVSGVNVKATLEKAIVMSAQLWTGDNTEGQDVPIVEINNTGTRPISELFAWLGISKLPENFDAEQFYDVFVNEIAAALGLALRHFWNNEKTTNRALEVVQEQRQQLKGPSTFVRAEQRLLNRKDGPMSIFTSGNSVARFGFIEEGDSASRLDNAEILERTTKALQLVSQVFGAAINIESYLAWMQALGVLPNELELVAAAADMVVVPGQTTPNNQGGNQTVTGDPSNVNKPGETTTESDPKPIAASPKKSLYLNYDEVMVNQDGVIIDRRVRIFSIEKVLSYQVEAAMEIIHLKGDDEAYADAVRAASLMNQQTFKAAYPAHKEKVHEWIDSQLIYDRMLAHEAIKKCQENQPLNDLEQSFVDEMVAVFRDDQAA